MKQFFENYGAVALGILAFLVLIAMITPVGNIIKTSLQGTVQTFSSGIKSQTDDMDNQMQQAFISNSNYSGFYNGKFYYNGEIPDKYKDTYLDNDVLIFPSGNVYRYGLGVDIVLDRLSYPNGYDGITFDIYKNGERIAENVQDFSSSSYDFNANDVYKIVIKDFPNNITIKEKEKTLTTQDLIMQGTIGLSINNISYVYLINASSN